MALKIGFKFDTTGAEKLPPSKAEMSVMGAVITAPNKDVSLEYDTLYSVNSDDAAFFAKLGTGGTGQGTMEAIQSQTGEFGKSARVVFVIVEEGADAAATSANAGGNAVTKTGVHAFMRAGQKVSVIPRILFAPGLAAYTGDDGSGNATLNPFLAQAQTVADSLLAVIVATGPSTTKQAALDWRETIGSKRVIPVETDVLVDVDGTNVQRPSEPFVAGLINRVDELHGGLPFHSAGNRTLYGITGPSRDVDFSLTDGDTEGQVLLEADMSLILRGEYGDDFSLADGGTSFLGVGTASNDSTWQFYNQVRGRDYIHLTMLRTLREYLAKYNLTGRLVKAYFDTIREFVADLAAGEFVHRDFKVELRPIDNPSGDLADGQITVNLAIEEPAPLLRGVIKSNRYPVALDLFVSRLAAEINEIQV